ncbi:MAG: hypothetical protein V4689_09855 [Verrucomicrobiota bacterium]
MIPHSPAKSPDGLPPFAGNKQVRPASFYLTTLLWLSLAAGLPAEFPSAPAPPAGKSRIIASSDPQVLAGLSPLNWIRTVDGIHSSVCGASFKFKFANTGRVVLNVDTTRLHYSAPSRFPVLGWTVNNGPVQSHQLAAGETQIILSDGVASPVIDFHLKGFSPFEDRFRGDIPPNAVTITGFTVAPKCQLTAPAAAPLWLNIGDSILSGDAAAYVRDQGRPPDDLWAASGEPRASYGYLLASHFGYQESRLAFGGYAWTGGLANNPPVADLVDFITSTTSRLANGKLIPAPRVVLINLGENGTPPVEAVVSSLTKLRERCAPDTRIMVMIPVSGRARAELTSAVEVYQQAGKDPHLHLIDLGKVAFDTADGQHATAAGHRAIYQTALPLFGRIVK